MKLLLPRNFNDLRDSGNPLYNKKDMYRRSANLLNSYTTSSHQGDSRLVLIAKYYEIKSLLS
jgi:hypothetical protein